MNKLLLLSVVFAAAGLTGCAGGQPMVGAPGQQRAALLVESRAATPMDPAMCIADMNRAKFFWYHASGPHAKLRILRLLTNEHPDPAGCDLILKLHLPGASVFSRDEITAYSAYTGEILWQGASTGGAGEYGAEYLLVALANDFLPGQPQRQKLEEQAASGVRWSVEAMRAAGLSLPSESALGGASRQAAEAARANPGPSVLTASRAPSASAAPSAPAAAPRVTSDLDVLPAARTAVSRRHAVVIGVERYREALPRADFASGDAKLAAEYFKRVLGVPEANLALLVDDRATKSDFEKYFERWLPNRVEAGDEVFVYFSGHGAPSPKSGDAYLVPFDGDPTYIAETGYPIKKLYERLAKLPAKRVLVAMDSCFSGAGGRSVIAKGARPLVTVQTEAVTGNVTVLAASAGDQISSSYQEKGHGLFTYFLLKGLKEKDGDFKAAFDYLKPEVARVARREYNTDQDPQWREGK